MGILDEAIREHLELKRDHGAEESEIEGLEAEAFGPADRPDATSPEAGFDPAAGGEAETRIISPGSSLTAPAGEGDQLDKVFDASREEGPGQGDPTAPGSGEPESARAETGPENGDTETQAGEATDGPGRSGEATQADEPTVAEHRIPGISDSPEPGSPAPDASGPGSKPAEAAPAEAVPADVAREGDDQGAAGDALEREREHLASHPTEHYDVDAAIAEEKEIDVLSESSLSDELDRALDGPDDLAPESAESPSPAEAAPEEPGTEPEPEFEPEFESAPPEDSARDSGEAASGAEALPDVEDEGEDVLEETPDFLEETPEHDKLWFEQKEPKDFDFGD